MFSGPNKDVPRIFGNYVRNGITLSEEERARLSQEIYSFDVLRHSYDNYMQTRMRAIAAQRKNQNWQEYRVTKSIVPDISRYDFSRDRLI